jgi:alpha-glucosidase (family GH31 glycosyl hydrolase)
MLVAPVFAGEKTRRVILPEGPWCSFWTGETVEGGSEFVVGTSLDRIPVYVKGDSIFPIGGIGDSTQDEATRQIVARVYGDGSLPFILGDKTTPSQLWLDRTDQSQIPSHVRGYVIQHWQIMRS